MLLQFTNHWREAPVAWQRKQVRLVLAAVGVDFASRVRKLAWWAAIPVTVSEATTQHSADYRVLYFAHKT